MLGSVTVRNARRPLAPSVRAASSSALPCSSISGISSRATNGNVTNKSARRASASAISMARPAALSVVAGDKLRGRTGTSGMAESPPAPRLQKIDGEQDAEGEREHHNGDRGGARIVVFLQLDDDENRR